MWDHLASWNRKKKREEEKKEKEKEKKKSFAGDFATISYTFCNDTFNDKLLHWKHQKRNIQKKVLISEACLQGPHGILSRLTLHGSLKVEDLNPIPYPIDVTVYSMAAARDIGKAPLSPRHSASDNGSGPPRMVENPGIGPSDLTPPTSPLMGPHTLYGPHRPASAWRT